MGPHSFDFTPATPLASPAIQAVTGGVIADGSYTVTLSYEDLAGNPAASDVNVNVRIDTTLPRGIFYWTPPVAEPGATIRMGGFRVD